MDNFKYSERSGMPGVWGWKELWWKADCGCIGYGKVLLKNCTGKFVVEICKDIDLEKEVLGISKLQPLSFDEKAKLLIDIEREFRLGMLAREILSVLREIGKITNGNMQKKVDNPEKP